MSDAVELAVDRGVDLDVVYVPPEPDQPDDALQEAKSVFLELDVKSYPLSEADQVGLRAHDLLVATGSRTARLNGL